MSPDDVRPTGGTDSGPSDPAVTQVWLDRFPWPLGCNFVPSTAVNQLEMWQAETFDLPTIDRELALAASIGFNTVRVFLHDLLWADDAAGLVTRLGRFLDVAASHGIAVMPVLLDGCWNNYAHLGAQPDPLPGVHNSQWLQSPQPKVVVEPERWGPVQAYVEGVIGAFADDDRILVWDLYNEPGNEGLVGNAIPLVEAVFAWARSVAPRQPLTVPIWNQAEEYRDLNRLQLDLSDVLTFHWYGDVEGMRALIDDLRSRGRAVHCTEYLARTEGNLLETHLPVLRDAGVGALNWGLVKGRTQTHRPWSWLPDPEEPRVWFHDLFHPDGSPYDPAEIDLIQRLAPTRSTT